MLSRKWISEIIKEAAEQGVPIILTPAVIVQQGHNCEIVTGEPGSRVYNGIVTFDGRELKP